MSTKHTDMCLLKTRDDELIFVLRAQDKLAPECVRLWAAHAEAAGAPAVKVAEARALATAMLDWQDEHGCKVPD